MSTPLILWGYHFTRIDIEFPESHVDGLLVCSPEYNQDEEELNVPEFIIARNADYAQFLDTLAASSDIDSKVMATVGRNVFDMTRRIDELADLATLYPDNRLANLHFLNACAVTADHPACDRNSVEQANRINVDNAVSWSLLAVYRAELDDELGVDVAMTQAALASEFDDYFAYQFRVLRDALQDNPDLRSLALVWDVIARSQLLLNNGYQVGQLCGYADPLRSALLQSCIDYGARTRRESQSLLMTMAGTGIQQAAYAALGDTVAANEIEREYIASQRSRSAPGSVWDQWNKMGSLMSYDIDLALFWLDSVSEHGETETAIQNTVAEARRRSADADYAPCNAPGPRLIYRG